MMNVENFYKGKKILVTGGTGSIGSEIVKQLLKFDPKVIRVFSRDEFKQYLFGIELESQTEKLRFLVGDVRDKERLKRAMEGIDIVFHAAAMKQVPLCEFNPFEAVKTNVMGTQNVIEAALDTDVDKVVFISTDKAVNPQSTMGATKLLSERLIIDANAIVGHKRTRFSAVRFGNVIGSRGSVVPLFVEQIKKGGPVSVTHNEMLRFMMTIPQAVRLVLESATMMKGGEIFVLKMPVLLLKDFVNELIVLLAPVFGHDSSKINRKIIGLRPGEKMFEELMTSSEAERALETDNKFVILPEIKDSLLKGIDYKYPGAFKLKSGSYITSGAKPICGAKIKELLQMAKVI